MFVCIIALCFVANGQKRYNSDYFIQKHNLQLPKIIKEMLDVTDLTHISDSWEYFYKAQTEILDSVVEYLTIERFPSSKTVESYAYNKDTAFVRTVSVDAGQC